ncbi:MAG: helix-turn-helix domain-containing protein [Spirochaetales bacterium]|nr:helix-turn-helix domain-containing protein [Spirochaetales bacterium]
MDIGIQIGQKIRELRTQAGLSQAAASEALSIPLRTYQSWEKDFTTSIQKLINICNFYNYPVENLIRLFQNPGNKDKNPMESETYKQSIFHMALQGKTDDEIFSWFSSRFPNEASQINKPELFIENSILDIYHLRPTLLHGYSFNRAWKKEQEIAGMFGLPSEQIIVAESGHIAHEVVREMVIAPFGAELLIKWSEEKPGFRLGISNGFTTARILDNIPRGRIKNLIFFPMNFTSTEVDFPISSTALISSFLYKSAGYGITTDTVTEEQVFSSMLLADAAILGIGTFSREGLYERMIKSVLGKSTVMKIREMGIIGDLNYNLFDSNGSEIDFPEVVTHIGNFEKESLVKSIGLDSLKEKSEKGGKIIIAGTGRHKAESVAVALKNGYANHLVTDETIADELLK